MNELLQELDEFYYAHSLGSIMGHSQIEVTPKPFQAIMYYRTALGKTQYLTATHGIIH